MTKKELKNIKNSLKRKGLLDGETISDIDNELQCFLEDKLEKNINIIKILRLLIKEKKSSDDKELLNFSLN